MTIEQIQEPIHAAYESFCKAYCARTTSDIPLLGEVDEYLRSCPGKQIRPTLLLLSAQACQHMTDKHILLAVVLELLHNASLMHDDVVDESDQRRGHDSVRHRWGNQVAVLCGDYYLSQVMTVLEEVNEPSIADVINHTVKDMCQGELKQLSLVRSGNSGLKDYIEVIGNKTASLMSTCCELGACHFDSKDGVGYRANLRNYGYHYGIVFQIRDDLNDMNKGHDIELPRGVVAQELIAHHAEEARRAIAPLPDSVAKRTLIAMLDASAPQPK